MTHRLRSERNEAAWQRLLVILNQLHQSSVFLREAVLLDRSAAVVTIREALERLRSVTTVEQLAQRLPGEIGRLGFRRSLVSRVTDGVWVARYAFVDRDDELAELLVQAGSEEPSRLTTQLLETELVRRRRPMIVRDPQKNPRMHQKLKVATNTRCYVAAPVISGDHVIGFLHADEYLGGSAMDEFSRDLLGMFAEGVGHAIERTAFYERLQAIRGQLHDYSRGVNDLIDEFVSANVELHSTASEGAEPVSPRPARVLDPGFSAAPAASPLTRRELEILRHMASGATNAQIANRLVLSEGTVKSHVKHILRKLGAANRAQAVAHYHVLVQQGR
ncbi:LuxR C-terminal-related transcriptional regulator [Streptomyces sp. RB6PN25]|uniref:LuxR C-terminal-related transcriptional regulator n=1 Tax=Streptomyces humicola TaxID=2953240 RepID=A0ABT1PRP0_9ACTN|nr:LuxR C-terminal-related transcriptional regulator [Streptomyces humicola]MCQ4079222.1 LuxR C-terminal-related transcriptional regulator [Streptomyces humicola]